MFRPSSRGGLVSPFVALGVGILRYHFSWPGADQISENTFGLHASIGSDVEIAGAPLRLEINDWWAAKGDPLEGSIGAGGPSLRRAAQHELTISLGWRFG